MTHLQGRVVNFKNAVIILTSNIGSATILESMNAGDFEGMKNTVTQQVGGPAGRCVSMPAIACILVLVCLSPPPTCCSPAAQCVQWALPAATASCGRTCVAASGLAALPPKHPFLLSIV